MSQRKYELFNPVHVLPLFIRMSCKLSMEGVWTCKKDWMQHPWWASLYHASLFDHAYETITENVMTTPPNLFDTVVGLTNTMHDGKWKL